MNKQAESMTTVIINSKEDADRVTAGMAEVTMDEFYDVVGPLDVVFRNGRYLYTSLFVERYGVEPVGVTRDYPEEYERGSWKKRYFLSKSYLPETKKGKRNRKQ